MRPLQGCLSPEDSSMHGTRKMGSQCSWLAGVEGKAGHGDIWGCVSTETGLSATHAVWSFSPCLQDVSIGCITPCWPGECKRRRNEPCHDSEFRAEKV